MAKICNKCGKKIGIWKTKYVDGKVFCNECFSEQKRNKNEEENIFHKKGAIITFGDNISFPIDKKITKKEKEALCKELFDSSGNRIIDAETQKEIDNAIKEHGKENVRIKFFTKEDIENL